MTYWPAHYASFAPGQDFSDLLNYIPPRTAAVQSEINAAGGNAAFTVNQTNITTANNLVALTGTAPVQIQSFLINGVAYAVTWTSVSNWVIRIPINSPTNTRSEENTSELQSHSFISYAVFCLKKNILLHT